MMAMVDMSVVIFWSDPGVANVFERAQSIARIGAPIAVGQFRRHGNFHAIAIRDLSDTNHFDDFANLVRQPAMTDSVLVALAVEIEMKFNHRCAPMFDGTHHDSGTYGMIRPADGDIERIAHRWLNFISISTARATSTLPVIAGCRTKL